MSDKVDPKLIVLFDNEKTVTSSSTYDVSLYGAHTFQVVVPGTSGSVRLETSLDNNFWSLLSGNYEAANSTGNFYINSPLKYIRARNLEVADSGVHVRYLGND